MDSIKKSLGAKTIAFPAPVFVVGTYDEIGKPNIMTAAWGGICCSKPPAIAVSLRMATYTYHNIVERKAFTLSIPSRKLAGEADFVGMASGRDVDKFETTGLTPVKSDLVNAPYVGESPCVIECSLLHTLEIGLHTLFVGEIMDVKIDEDCLTSNGKPDVRKLDPIAFAPDVREYYALGDFVGAAFSLGKDFLGRGTGS